MLNTGSPKTNFGKITIGDYPLYDVLEGARDRFIRLKHLKHAAALGDTAAYQVTLLVHTVEKNIELRAIILSVTAKFVILTGDISIPITAIKGVIFI